MPVEDEIMLDITDDMYCGSLSSDVVSEFICMLCYGIVYDPMKCSTCNNLVCKKCVNMKKLKIYSKPVVTETAGLKYGTILTAYTSDHKLQVMVPCDTLPSLKRCRWVAEQWRCKFVIAVTKSYNSKF